MESLDKKMELTEDYFTNVFSAYSNKIFNFAYRMTGDENVAADITQETFIKVLDAYDDFRGESSIATWIYAITKNACFHHISKARKSTFQSIEGLIEKCSGSCDPYEEEEKRSYINQVKEGCLLGLLRCLSFYQRMAFILHVLNEISIKDTSRILNRSVNSTRILIHRARNGIKTFLCRNCSLYQETNKCKGENLVSFSLRQGWIKTYNPKIGPEKIECELKAFKDEIALYKSSSDRNQREDLIERIISAIEKNGFHIFSPKKVK